jgi:hypothetical protein
MFSASKLFGCEMSSEAAAGLSRLPPGPTSFTADRKLFLNSTAISPASNAHSPLRHSPRQRLAPRTLFVCMLTIAALELSACGGSGNSAGLSDANSTGSIATSGGSGTPGSPILANQATGIPTLVLTVAGTVQGVNYDTVNVNGRADLSGLLIINFASSFQPRSGQKFILMNATGGVVGGFSSIVTNGVNVTSGQDANSYFITIN